MIFQNMNPPRDVIVELTTGVCVTRTKLVDKARHSVLKGGENRLKLKEEKSVFVDNLSKYLLARKLMHRVEVNYLKGVALHCQSDTDIQLRRQT